MKVDLGLSRAEIQNIHGRQIFVFDTSIWNALADGKTKDAIETREILKVAVESGSIFCPLTSPVVWELRKQAGASLHRTAELMETLSLNIAFRSMKQIFEYEIDHLLRFLLYDEFIPLRVYELFGSLLSYVGVGFELKYPHNNLSEEEKALSVTLAKMVKEIPLTVLIAMLGDRSSPKIKAKLSYQAANIARRNATKGNRKQMKRIEMEEVAKSVVIPLLNKKRSVLPIVDQIRVVNRVKSLPRSKKHNSAIEYIVGYLPMISAYIDILTVSGYDIARTDSDNDFFDREISVYGLSYATVFAAKDKWIKSLVSLCRAEGSFGALCYAHDVAELRSKIKI